MLPIFLIEPRVRRILFVAALFVALFLYTVHLTSDLYGDEVAHTYRVVATGNFWANIKDPSMCHPPLYFVLAKVSYNIIGKPWAIRIPSLLFSLGSIVLVAFVAKRILGSEFYLPAIWLATLSPFLLEFSAEGRAYSMLIFFSIALLWSFLLFLQRENVSNMLLLSAISICGALTHYFFFFQLISLCIYYVIVRKGVSRFALGSCGIIGLMLAPAFYQLFIGQNGQFANYLQVGWSEIYFSVTNFLGRLCVAIAYGFSTFSLPNLDPARNITFTAVRENWLLILLVLISFAGIAYACLRLVIIRLNWVWLFLIGIFIPVGLGLVAGKSGLYLIREKHLAVIWVFYFFLLLLVLRYLIRARFGWFVIACHFSVMLVSLFHYVVYPDDYTRRMNWTGLNRTLEREIGKKDVILFYNGDLQSLSLGNMRILEQDVKAINLQTDRPRGISLTGFAQLLGEKFKGTVFLINNETDRHAVDPNSEVIMVFRSIREICEQRFGRNLILYRFKPYSSLVH